MSYYDREKLGEKQALTPEGFLLCLDVAIARTGTMVYGPGEVPVTPGLDGIIYIEREAAEVFRPETIASFNGKPVTMGHPSTDVTPANWKELAVGVVLNPRRGVAAQDDLLLADVIIMNQDEILAVRRGLREVSCGYDAEYIDLAPHPVQGRARQVNIVGNHLALVDAGRCGPRCAIGDTATTLTLDERNTTMTWLEKLKAAFTAKDQSAFDAALAEAPKEGPVTLTKDQLKTIVAMTRDAHEEGCDCKACKTKDHTYDAIAKDVRDIKDSVDAIDGRVKKMEDAEKEREEEKEEEKKKTEDNEKILGSLELEAPPGTGDRARKAKDSEFLADSFQEAASLAEVITPGIRIPTYDRAAAPSKTLDSLCTFRKSVLDLARSKPELRTYVDSVLGGQEVSKLTCDQSRTLFRAVGNFAKNLNNTNDRALPGHGGGTGVAGRAKTIADLNKANRNYYKTHTA